MRTDMRARLGEILADYQATRSHLATLNAELASLTATARSGDRAVTATVSPQGELIALAIDADLADRLDAAALAARVLEASGLAVTQVRQRLGDTLRGGLPGHLRDLVAADGSVDVRRLLPDDPGVLFGGARP